MTDRRLHFATPQIAPDFLKGQVQADRYITPTLMKVREPVVDVLKAPGGARDRQAVFGQTVSVLVDDGEFSFVDAGQTSTYVGHIRSNALGPVGKPSTHWVSLLSSHVYSAASFKSPETLRVPFGSRFSVVGETGKFFETDLGFVPKQHLSESDFAFSDPAEIAQQFLRCPYLWGGNSPLGIDCSGLVQAALTACGIECPGDSDLQEKFLTPSAQTPSGYARNLVMFWKSHVALTLDETRLIHANVHKMAVSIEGIEDAIARIEGAGDGPVTSKIQI